MYIQGPWINKVHIKKMDMADIHSHWFAASLRTVIWRQQRQEGTKPKGDVALQPRVVVTVEDNGNAGTLVTEVAVAAPKKTKQRTVRCKNPPCRLLKARPGSRTRPKQIPTVKSMNFELRFE